MRFLSPFRKALPLVNHLELDFPHKLVLSFFEHVVFKVIIIDVHLLREKQNQFNNELTERFYSLFLSLFFAF